MNKHHSLGEEICHQCAGEGGMDVEYERDHLAHIKFRRCPSCNGTGIVPITCATTPCDTFAKVVQNLEYKIAKVVRNLEYYEKE
jgi:DnaJ-class molecular chaperone